MSTIENDVATQEQTAIADPEPGVTRLLSSRVLRGWNVHHHSTVFSQRVDLGRRAGVDTRAFGPEFPGRFVGRFASLTTASEGGLPAGFVAALNGPAGVPFERALLEAIRAVELAVASTMRRLDTVEFTKLLVDPKAPGVVEVVWECHSGSLSRFVARAALAGLLELTPEEPALDFARLFRKLQRRARRRQWSPATAVLAMEAKRRGVPFEPLAGAHVRLGDGALQRVVSASLPAGADLGRIFAEGVAAGIPTAVIAGNRRAGALARDLDGLLRAAGGAVGLATRKLTTISGRPVDATSVGRRGGASFLLSDPRVETLVYAVSPTSVVNRGLRLSRATAVAILEPKAGTDPDEYRRGIDVCVAATTGAIAIGDDHPLAAHLADMLPPERLVLIAPRRLRALVIRHLSNGGCAVVREKAGDASIVTLRGFRDDTVAAVPVASILSGSDRAGEGRIRRGMFTAAIAFGLGLTGPEIAAAFEKRRYFRR